MPAAVEGDAQADDGDPAIREGVGAEALTGGNSAEVWRRGQRVHRSAGRWTGAVDAVLGRLQHAGVTLVPRPLGTDAQGRQVVSYLAGEVAHYPLPDWVWEDQVLIDAAHLVRRIHDATTALAAEPLPWQLPAREPAEVVCHNDLAPYNMVFDRGRLVGLIDFDTAAPGPRLWDLAHLGYRLAPLVSDAGAGAPRHWHRRLELLLRAYGSRVGVADLLAMMVRRVQAVRTGRTDLAEHAAMYRRDSDRIGALA